MVIRMAGAEDPGKLVIQLDGGLEASKCQVTPDKC